MKRVCKYCGKTIPQNKSFWITIENDGFLEGMEDHIFFCNKQCFNPWKTNFLRQKSRQKKANYKEKLLQNPNRKASDEDLLGILKTLTKAQKDEMILHMMGICYARSDKTIKGILEIINGLKDYRINKKKFEVLEK